MNKLKEVHSRVKLARMIASNEIPCSCDDFHTCPACRLSDLLMETIAMVVEVYNESDGMSRHEEVCAELSEIYERKNHDYGDSFGQTYKEFGMLMPAIRLDDKLRRYKQLIKGEQKVNDESVRDTLLDLANYAIMTVMEMDKEDELND